MDDVRDDIRTILDLIVSKSRASDTQAHAMITLIQNSQPVINSFQNPTLTFDKTQTPQEIIDARWAQMDELLTNACHALNEWVDLMLPNAQKTTWEEQKKIIARQQAQLEAQARKTKSAVPAMDWEALAVTQQELTSKILGLDAEISDAQFEAQGILVETWSRLPLLYFEHMKDQWQPCVLNARKRLENAEIDEKIELICKNNAVRLNVE